LTGTDTTDLVAALRAELAAIEPARRCDRIAERAGLGMAAQGRARTPLIGRLAVRLDDAVSDTDFDWDAAKDHCRTAWLRGAFLARGSLSVTSTGTHLELIVDGADLEGMAERLAAIGLPAGARVRRSRGVLTWKNADTITELLRRIGASAATLELESRLVHRALTGHLNRVVNAENANLRRAVDAAGRQLADITALEARGALPRLPRDARRVAAERRRAPEATLSEIAATLDMSRSQVQRAFDLIGSAALHDVSDDNVIAAEQHQAPRYS
jgi:DNA-binding protein WhiA